MARKNPPSNKSSTTTRKAVTKKTNVKPTKSAAAATATARASTKKGTAGKNSHCYECPITHQPVYIAKATLKDLKSPSTYSNSKSRHKRLWTITSPQVRNDVYVQAAEAIANYEQSLLPSFGGRSWQVTCRLTEPNWSGQVLFRAWKGRMELAVLPHLLDKIPTPPTWAGKKSRPDEYQSVPIDGGASMSNGSNNNNVSNCSGASSVSSIQDLQQREISSLSQLAWNLREGNKYPVPSVSIKWITPENKVFHSRKTAWEHATEMAEREVQINKCIRGIGASGKLLQPFFPAVAMTLNVGKLRFERDGLWVVGQELDWQESRAEALEEEDIREEERKQLMEPKTGLALFLQKNKASYRETHKDCTSFRQAEIELRQLWKTLPRSQQEVWNKQVRKDRRKVAGTNNSNDGGKQKTAAKKGKKTKSEPEPEVALSMTPKAFYVKSRRYEYQKERRAQGWPISLSEADIWLKEAWKTSMTQEMRDEWKRRLIAHDEAQARNQSEEEQQGMETMDLGKMSAKSSATESASRVLEVSEANTQEDDSSAVAKRCDNVENGSQRKCIPESTIEDNRCEGLNKQMDEPESEDAMPTSEFSSQADHPLQNEVSYHAQQDSSVDGNVRNEEPTGGRSERALEIETAFGGQCFQKLNQPKTEKDINSDVTVQQGDTSGLPNGRHHSKRETSNTCKDVQKEVHTDKTNKVLPESDDCSHSNRSLTENGTGADSKLDTIADSDPDRQAAHCQQATMKVDGTACKIKNEKDSSIEFMEQDPKIMGTSDPTPLAPTSETKIVVDAASSPSPTTVTAALDLDNIVLSFKATSKKQLARKQQQQQQPSKQARQRWCMNQEQIDLCFAACMDHFDTVMRTVKARDLHRELQDGFDVLRERGHGRYDMELPAFDTEVFNFLTDTEKAPWMPVVREILGDDAVLIHKGCFLSLPGAAPQEYHQDGVHLTTQTQKPCHAINVFIPLVDLNTRNGPTEFCLGSHMLGLEGYDRDFVETPKVEAGRPVIFDYRLGHRGLGNSSQACRPIVYCTYARGASENGMKEFRDSVNFSRKRYHRIGELSSAPISREERRNNRKRSIEARKEEELLQKVLSESCKDTTVPQNETRAPPQQEEKKLKVLGDVETNAVADKTNEVGASSEVNNSLGEGVPPV